jgi:hypothetical protein
MKRKCKYLVLMMLMTSMSFTSSANAQDRSPDKPNIVLISMDNFGWGELGCYGGGILRGAPTPRIDKLATEGMRLLNCNVEASCTPSRVSGAHHDFDLTDLALSWVEAITGQLYLAVLIVGLISALVAKKRN